MRKLLFRQSNRHTTSEMPPQQSSEQRKSAVSEANVSTPLSAGSLQESMMIDLVQHAAQAGAKLALEEFQSQRRAKQDRGSGDVKFGQALRSTRERDGLTQEEFAKRANVHYTTIGKIETGDRGMTAETLAKILWASGMGFQAWALRYLATGQTE
jgi:DNA-binding XRE family transcriptional regulator